MRTDWLQPLLGQTPPFTTVHIDISGVGETAARETANRWRVLRRDLERDGASNDVIEMLEQAVTTPPERAGAGGRFLIASAAGIHVDRVLSEAPSPSQAFCGADPALLPEAVQADRMVDYLLITVDRMGADLARSGSDLAAPVRHSTVEGDQDEITKTQVTATMQGRVDHRAQDSWERNAAVVAAELDRIAQTDAPDLMILTGDVRAVKLVLDAVGPRTRDFIQQVSGGSRSSGVNQEALDSQVETALSEYRGRQREATLGAFRQALGQDSGAVASLVDVIDVLRRGQVSELIIVDSALSSAIAERNIWAGPEPMQLALVESELQDIGIVEGRHQMRALVAIIRAAIAQHAGLLVVPEGEIYLADHVGAVLRWVDNETPRDSAPSLSSDPDRLNS